MCRVFADLKWDTYGNHLLAFLHMSVFCEGFSLAGSSWISTLVTNAVSEGELSISSGLPNHTGCAAQNAFLSSSAVSVYRKASHALG